MTPFLNPPHTELERNSQEVQVWHLAAETVITPGAHELCVVGGMKITRKDTEFMKASRTSVRPFPWREGSSYPQTLGCKKMRLVVVTLWSHLFKCPSSMDKARRVSRGWASSCPRPSWHLKAPLHPELRWIRVLTPSGEGGWETGYLHRLCWLFRHVAKKLITRNKLISRCSFWK